MDANNNFFGVRVSQPGVNVNKALPSQLLFQNDYSTQTFFMNNGLASSGQINFGKNPDGTYGMSIENASDTVTFEINSGGMSWFGSNGKLITQFNGSTWFYYDNLGNVVMMAGLLPVAQIYGWAVAAPGQNLSGVV